MSYKVDGCFVKTYILILFFPFSKTVRKLNNVTVKLFLPETVTRYANTNIPLQNTTPSPIKNFNHKNQKIAPK